MADKETLLKELIAAKHSKRKLNQYKPHPISNRSFTLDPKTLALDSHASLKIARFDERMKHSPQRDVIWRLFKKT